MIIELENREEKELFVNGAQVFIRREDMGPTEHVVIEVKTPGYACYRRGEFVQLGFMPREVS